MDASQILRRVDINDESRVGRDEAVHDVWNGAGQVATAEIGPVRYNPVPQRGRYQDRIAALPRVKRHGNASIGALLVGLQKFAQVICGPSAIR